MYCVMRASAPSLYNVYRRYDVLFFFNEEKKDVPTSFLINRGKGDGIYQQPCTLDSFSFFWLNHHFYLLHLLEGYTTVVPCAEEL